MDDRKGGAPRRRQGRSRNRTSAHKIEPARARKPASNHSECTALLEEAHLLLSRGEIDAAIDAWQRVVVLDPDSVEAWSRLSNVLITQGRYAEAVDAYTKAVQHGEVATGAWDHFNLAYANAKCGRLEEAIDYYLEAIKENPDDYEVWYNLGNTYLEIHDPSRAIGAYDKALALCPDDHEIWNNLGNAHAERSEMPDAERCFRDALRLCATYAPAWNNLGNVLEDLISIDEAIDCYTQAIEHDQAAAPYRLNRAIAFAKLGSYEKARQDILVALQIAPDLRAIIASIDDLEEMKSEGHLDDILEEPS